MELPELLEGLLSEPGVVRVEAVPSELRESVVIEERSVRAVGGSMAVDNLGLKECLERNTLLCVFTDRTFRMPPAISMNMVDSEGKVVGHNLPHNMILEYMKRRDVVFVSDDFIMYADAQPRGEVTMEMLAVSYRGKGGWIPDDASPVVWFPSTTSCDIMRGWFSETRDDLAIGFFAVDL